VKVNYLSKLELQLMHNLVWRGRR